MEPPQRTQRWCLGGCLSVARTSVALPSDSSSPERTAVWYNKPACRVWEHVRSIRRSLRVQAHDVQPGRNNFQRVSQVDLDNKVLFELSIPLATPAKAPHHLALCCCCAQLALVRQRKALLWLKQSAASCLHLLCCLSYLHNQWSVVLEEMQRSGV